MSASAPGWVPMALLAGVAGLPTHKSNLKKRVEEGGWETRKVPARGGLQVQVALHCLPEIVRLALANPHGQAGRASGGAELLGDEMKRRAIETARQTALAEYSGLKKPETTRVELRMKLLAACENYRVRYALGVDAGEAAFARAYSTGEVALDDAIHAAIPNVSARTLRNWRTMLKSEGITRLAGNYGTRKGTGTIDTQQGVHDYVLSMLHAYPHIMPIRVREGLAARFGRTEGVKLPSLTSLERWIKAWKRENAELVLATSNPDAWKNKHMVAMGSISEGATRLNAIWEADSTPADLLLTDGRFHLVGLIDVYSRQATLLVTKTSTAEAVTAVFRRACAQWGLPELLRTDNGKEYTGHRVLDFAQALDVEIKLCPPFQPWHKGHIERFFQTFNHGLVELLAGYSGHNVADAQAIRARLSFSEQLLQKSAAAEREAIELRMSSAQLQEFCDAWLEKIYQHNPHEGLQGRSPFEMAAGWTGGIRQVMDIRTLDLLLSELPGGNARRTVQKKGIKVENDWYIAVELEAHVGREVTLRWDGRDFGRLFVFGEQGYIGVAENPERTGIDRREVAMRAKRLQQERVQADKAELRAIGRKVKTADIVTEIIEDRAEKAGRLVRFPHRAEPHETPAVLAASQALESLQVRPPVSEISDADAAAWRATLEQEQIPGALDNSLAARRRLKQAALTVTAEPVFHSTLERVEHLLRQSRHGALTEEQRTYLLLIQRTNRATYLHAAEMVEAALGPAPADAAGSQT